MELLPIKYLIQVTVIYFWVCFEALASDVQKPDIRHIDIVVSVWALHYDRWMDGHQMPGYVVSFADWSSKESKNG